MPVSHHLQRRLKEALGADAGDDLVNLLEVMEATRGDIGELRHELERRFAAVETTLERGFKEQTRFFFLAWAVLLVTIVGLYSR